MSIATSKLVLHTYYYDKKHRCKTRFYGREKEGQKRFVFMLESPSYLEVLYDQDQTRRLVSILP